MRPFFKFLASIALAAALGGCSIGGLLGGGGKPPDIAKDLTPAANEPIVSSGVDKFANTDLDRMLREKNVKTVIVVGTAAHGAVLYTASGAAMRGYKVVVPLDGISADTAYAEQYTAWHLANAPVVSAAVTLTTLGQIGF